MSKSHLRADHKRDNREKEGGKKLDKILEELNEEGSNE